MKVEEKWPTFFQIKKINDSVLSKAMTVFLIIGVVNQKQSEDELLNKLLDLHAKFEIEDDRYVIASLVTEEKLELLYENFESKATGPNSYRGQYLPVAREIVKVCKEALNIEG